MIKVLIADDEPRIRRGIRNIINWEEEGFKLIGEAEDGEEALFIAKEKKPDILLLDICMPFINGIQLIEELNNILYNPVVIIISGHDEFNYAQAALRLKVFDYILKPIDRNNLRNLILKAKEEVISRIKLNERESFKDMVLENNLSYLKEEFFKAWLNGKLDKNELKIRMENLKIHYSDNMGLILIKISEKNFVGIVNKNERELISYGIINLSNEFMSSFTDLYVFRYSSTRVVILCNVESIIIWKKALSDLEEKISSLFKIDIIVENSLLNKNPMEIKEVFSKLKNNVLEKSKKTPIVLEVEKYIKKNYGDEKLSIEKLSNKLGISQTYLTRLLKKELGMNFIDYLTHVRIQNAIELMKDPSIKIYEIASLVGYNTQHYFSNVFKKNVGMAPNDYRVGMNNEE
ncbi:response regulator [Clostridium sp. Sa3CUN1]|uniref:Stage 0 sporulation protein A homolog n=1 Tax=Clostridium gallinarum TaxID=2762246 RepID=A0ABR8Q2F4_9CLOT|nr:response regulator [Clostridium gallinarum]MBD7914600.1 response regulator [Clostridium gallinarum]